MNAENRRKLRIATEWVIAVQRRQNGNLTPTAKADYLTRDVMSQSVLNRLKERPDTPLGSLIGAVLRIATQTARGDLERGAVARARREILMGYLEAESPLRYLEKVDIQRYA